jgi:aspartate-semialdehyde dehydrogenase
MKKYNVAIVGATGLVGSTFLKILDERNFPINNLILLASKRSAGKEIKFRENTYIVEELKPESFEQDIDIALFSAGGTISKEYAPIATSHGITVIDNSSAWRMDESIPLVVPEVNPETAINNLLIANPNCSTIQVVVPLKVLDDLYTIKRVVYSTYQAVSGSGIAGIRDLKNGLKGESPTNYPHPIAFNCLPHIDVFTEDGYTKEELKMINETRKILDRPNLPITSTCVRVPVENSHAVSVNLEFEKEFEIEELKMALSNKEGIVLEDDVKNNIYPMPISATGSDKVFVGRIRRDRSIKNGINLWVVADNIRKGAASNTVQIAELIINN